MKDKEKTFRNWIDNHSGLIFKIVRAFADTPQDKDDLFQEILLQLWLSIDKFQNNCKPTSWIYRVAFNTAIISKRNIKRKNKGPQVFLTDINDLPQKPNETQFSQQQAIISKLYKAIHQLPKPQRSIILLHLDSVSYDEMAQILGISKTNVGVRINRTKKQLVKLMKGVIDDF